MGETCQKILDEKFFHKDKNAKDGLSNYCKECSSIQKKNQYEKHKEEHLERKRIDYKNNTEKYAERNKKYRDEHPEIVKANNEKYAETHKEEKVIYNKQYNIDSKNDISKQKKIYYEDNRMNILESKRQYNLRNAEKIKVIKREMYKDNIGKVYFITDGEYIKIGHTIKKIKGRMIALQVGNCKELTLLGYILGEVSKEKEIHNLFRHLLIRGEWFKYSQEIIDYLYSLDYKVK